MPRSHIPKSQWRNPTEVYLCSRMVQWSQAGLLRLGADPLAPPSLPACWDVSITQVACSQVWNPRPAQNQNLHFNETPRCSACTHVPVWESPQVTSEKAPWGLAALDQRVLRTPAGVSSARTSLRCVHFILGAAFSSALPHSSFVL